MITSALTTPDLNTGERRRFMEMQPQHGRALFSVEGARYETRVSLPVTPLLNNRKT
jgi:hypothetical protein